MLSLFHIGLQFLFSTFLWPKEGVLDLPQPLTFELRHQHGVSNSSRVIFSDHASSFAPESLRVNTRHLGVQRPTSFPAFSAARLRSMRRMENEFTQWHETKVVGPNVESRETLVQLAKMTQNSYTPGPEHEEWYDLGTQWNSVRTSLFKGSIRCFEYFTQSRSFGWEPATDGLRGHVFVSTDNSTVVISIKGTSPGWLAGSGGPTVKKDKLNDNLLFSCCCAKVGPTWFPVCDCASGGYTCDQDCLEKSLLEDSLFYSVGMVCYFRVIFSCEIERQGHL
jgi:putative lipase involved disintegration of autophagic bodies